MSKIGITYPTEPGVKRTVLCSGEKVMMVEFQFEQGAIGSLHSHPHEQISYCLQGLFEFTVDGAIYLLKAGETLHIPSGATHGVKTLEAGKLLDAFSPIRADFL